MAPEESRETRHTLEKLALFSTQLYIIVNAEPETFIELKRG